VSKHPRRVDRSRLGRCRKTFRLLNQSKNIRREQARPGTANALTIDVADYFQVEAFASTIEHNIWESLPRRVERNTARYFMCSKSLS
jgi:hypothetical protein